MKNKVKYVMALVFLFVIFNLIPTYANDIFYWNGMEIQDVDDESIILPENIKESRGITRGEVISTGLVSIANKGGGKAALTIETLAHVRCDRICNTITLQRWDDSADDWVKVLSYDFEARQEDNPDVDLTSLINGLDVENLQAGTYRARGLHAVYLGDVYEGFTSKTQGIQITKY